MNDNHNRPDEVLNNLITIIPVQSIIQVAKPACIAAPKAGLLKNCKKGDLLITMGAGNVVNIGDNLLKS